MQLTRHTLLFFFAYHVQGQKGTNNLSLSYYRYLVSLSVTNHSFCFEIVQRPLSNIERNNMVSDRVYLHIASGHSTLTVNSIWGGGTIPPSRKKFVKKTANAMKMIFHQ